MNNSNNSSTNTSINNNTSTNNVINPTVSIQERAIIIENIKKFLIEHLPTDQVTSPQKAHELAVRFENHVALTTSTKEQYQGMISEKLRIIKQKSTEPSPILMSAQVQANQQSQQNQQSQSSISPQEISQITARLIQIRPQIPQIDKLLLLHSKLTTPPIGTLEMVKKLTDCRNILINQIEICTNSTKKLSFVMNLSQLNLLIEQVQRLFNSLVSKMKESAGIQQNTAAATVNNAHLNSQNSQTSQSAHSTQTYHSSKLTSSSSISSSKSGSSLSSSSRNAIKSSSNLNDSSSIDKRLIQKLSLPPDQSYFDDNWIKRFILHNQKQQQQRINISHLKLSNRLLFHELKLLKSSSNLKYHVQEIGFGSLNILISIQNDLRLIFKITQKYPYDQLIYKTETTSTILELPKDPKTFPITITNTITNILRNFKGKVE